MVDGYSRFSPIRGRALIYIEEHPECQLRELRKAGFKFTDINNLRVTAGVPTRNREGAKPDSWDDLDRKFIDYLKKNPNSTLSEIRNNNFGGVFKARYNYDLNGAKAGAGIVTNATYTDPGEKEYFESGIIGQSPVFKRMMGEVKLILPTDTTVLLSGETGTGKTELAKFIHKYGPRAQTLLVEFNAGTSSNDDLALSELLGHDEGAYTGATRRLHGSFERADRGTLIFQDLQLLTPKTQGALLKYFDDHQVTRQGCEEPEIYDARIIAATNRDLAEMTKKGEFKEDLYYRLNRFVVKVPPLRERNGDIPLLVRRMLELYSKRHKKPVLETSGKYLEALERYSWPGNIRELDNLMEVSVLRGEITMPQGSTIEIFNRTDLGTARTPIVEPRKFQQPIILPETSAHTNGNGSTAHAEAAIGRVEAAIPRIVNDGGIEVDGFPPTIRELLNSVVGYLNSNPGIDIDDVRDRLLVEAIDVTDGNLTAAARLLRVGREQIRYASRKSNGGTNKVN